MRNKLVLSGFLLALFFSLSISSTQAQTFVDLSGRWKSSSGNTFFILPNGDGFKYQNTKTQTWFYANWQNDYDHHKYEAPNFKKNDGTKYSIYFTVKNRNSMSVYNSGTGSSSTWTRIVE